jgi:cell division protein FtsL
MAKTKNKQDANRSKLTKAEQQARVQAARQREQAEILRREATSRTKKIFTVVVCVILVLALGIPTMALTLFSL